MAYRELDIKFGGIVRAKRKNLKISQERLSELVGISPQYCRDIEKGKSRPSWVIVVKIWKILHLDISWFVDTYIVPEINEAIEPFDIKF